MTYRVITATLTARTAVHVGSGEGSGLTDALLRRDAKGQPFIPGTAIAGALRSLLTRLAPRLWADKPLCVALSGSEGSCRCAVCQLFGDVSPSDEEGSQSAASRLLVFNAMPIGTQPRPLIRDGVGIDRVTGAAARAGSVKFNLEVLPAGAAFEMRMELRDPAPDDKTLLAAGLAEWDAGRLWLGGRVARGLGAFKLDQLEYKTLPLDRPEQLLTFLKDDQSWQRATAKPGWLAEQIGKIKPVPRQDKPEAVSRGWFSLTGTLQAEGPLLTNDTLSSGASGFDHAPLLVQWGDWQHPVLTGAGLRGVLRSHAERTARTLATLTAWDAAPGREQRKEHFLNTCPACDPNVRDNEKGRRLPLESCDSLLAKDGIPSTEIVEDDHLCPACRLFGSTRHGSRLIVEDALFAGDKPKLKMLDFLAIDRFTGGGAEHLKFDALALWQPAFTLRLYLNNSATWELGWLWLVLRDLTEGWLQVGFGAAKGFGRVTLKDWKATFGYLLSEDAPDVTQLGLAEQRSGVYTTVQVTEATADWRKLAQKWVDAFHEEVKKVSRAEGKLALTEDSYFGRIDTLYPVMKGGMQ